jgi:hypothetical protein
MRTPRRLTACLSVFAVAALAQLASSPAASGEAAAAASPEKFKGRAISTGTGRTQAGYITIEIDHVTTNEEAARYASLLTASGQEAVVKLWQDEKKIVGMYKFAQAISNDLRVVRVWPLENGGRRIFLLSDRPLAAFEVARNLRSQDYPISIVELVLDAEGKGEGKIYPAVELAVKDGELSIKSWGHDPVDLKQIEPVKPKKK